MKLPSCKTAALNAGLGKDEINKLLISGAYLVIKIFNK